MGGTAWTAALNIRRSFTRTRLTKAWSLEQEQLKQHQARATERTVQEWPACHFCGAPAAYDAVVIDAPTRPRAVMCATDMSAHGPGMLGTGIGQRLVLDAPQKPARAHRRRSGR